MGNPDARLGSRALQRTRSSVEGMAQRIVQVERKDSNIKKLLCGRLSGDSAGEYETMGN